jgi:4-aminobutyrate aminotransferase
MIARETIDRWQSGSHGSTFGGNPVCCAAALATLDLVERELMANAATQGERLLTAMQRLAARYQCIGDVRGRGLMIGVEFVKDRDTREPDSETVHKLVETAFERGLLLLGAGKSALRLAPPLIIDADDIDTGVQIIETCLAELTAA